MFSLYDIVKLKEDDKSHGVKKSFTGTVVDVLGKGEAYTVEFFDDTGETIEDALLTEYKAEDLVLVEAFKD